MSGLAEAEESIGKPALRAASVRRVHPYDDPSSNRCIRRPRMHPQSGARAHSPKAPHRSSCPPRTRGRTRSGNEESEKGAEEVEDDVLASCLSFLRSHPTLRLRNKPPGSSLLRFEGAGRTTGSDGAAGEWMRAGAGSRARDNADALSLVLLLSASVLRVPDELPGLSVWSSKGAQRVGEVEAV